MCTLECNYSVYIWIHADVYPECNCSASIYMDTCRLCTWNAIAALVYYMDTCRCVPWNAIAALLYIWIHPNVYPGMQLQRICILTWCESPKMMLVFLFGQLTWCKPVMLVVFMFRPAH